uniref:Uncharacterized protein n=1 Tax=Anopheles farauti TaxID=69004 RepID=A0A182Q3W1_9DIPT
MQKKKTKKYNDSECETCLPSGQNLPVQETVKVCEIFPGATQECSRNVRKMITALIFLVAGVISAVSGAAQQGYNYPKPTTPAPPFTGYSYPKPSKPFAEGYVYTTPKCPLVLPSTSTITNTQTVVSTSYLTQTQTLPPITSTQVDTSYITLPPVVQTQTDTSTLYISFTMTDYIVSTTTEIQPTTVTSLLTTTYCQPNTYLPPPTPPPNTYLPVDPPAKEYLPQRAPTPPQSPVVRVSGASDNQGSFISTFVQQQSGPIKRATVGEPAASAERVESNEVIPGAGKDRASVQPAINIIYVDRNGATEGQPPAGLMNWLLCKFNLASGSCAEN